jgi:cation diffusion facilitator family transporter
LDELKGPDSDATAIKPIPSQSVALQREEGELRAMRFAMRISLAFGLLMLVGKTTAYFMTGSAAILSDAAESVIHVVAVAFAAFSLRLSTKPAKPSFLYGYERITFFSAGFEGAMIVLAAVFILYAAIEKWLAGLKLENLGAGTLMLLAAGVLNAGLGWYLIRVGRRGHSLILEANGKHVLTDSWTSFGVVAGLGLVMLTKWKPFDPLLAIAVAINILWAGGHLVWRAAVGLLDHSDPEVGKQIRNKLDAICSELGLQYHGVRYRTTGHRQIIEVHLLFPYVMAVGEAHRLATQLEERLPRELSVPAEVFTHLESAEDHAAVHAKEHYTGKPG